MRSRSARLCTRKWTSRFIPSALIGVWGSFSRNVRTTRSLTRIVGACEVSTTNLSGRTRSFNHSASNWVTLGCATPSSALSTVVLGRSPSRPNQAGVKIAGLKEPSSTTLTVLMSGSIRTMLSPSVVRPENEGLPTASSSSGTIHDLALWMPNETKSAPQPHRPSPTFFPAGRAGPG